MIFTNYFTYSNPGCWGDGEMGRGINWVLVINKTGVPHSFEFEICNNSQPAL
jgi:hypothetical protein